MCHSDTSAKADVSTGLDCMQFGKYPARIWSQCGKHLTVAESRHNIMLVFQHYFVYADTSIKTEQSSLCHGNEPDIVFGVATCFGVANNVHCILLSLEPGGQKVSIPHVLAVVHTRKNKGHSLKKKSTFYYLCIITENTKISGEKSGHWLRTVERISYSSSSSGTD